MKTMHEIRIDRTKTLAENPGTGHNRWHPDIPPVIRCNIAASPSTSRSASSSTSPTCWCPRSCPKTSLPVRRRGHELLVTMTTRVPNGTPDATIEDIRTREAARSRELAAAGHLLRLWHPPLESGEWRTLGLFAADDRDQLGAVLPSMPLRVWRTERPDEPECTCRGL